MSKFLALVKENTPGEEQESLADKFHRFAERVSALEEGRAIDVDELLLELNGLNEELTTLGGVPEVEDQEVDMKDMQQVAVALDTANKIKASSDPTRPSRGVKKIDKSIGNIGTAVSKKLDQVAKAIK
jgi:hypothetical protein